LKAEEPHIGPKVAGAILHHQDGHVNPLRLLRALARDVRQRGGKVLTGEQVVDVSAGFALHCASGRRVDASRIVLCAGLGAALIGPKLGFQAPVRPQRGQILVTEKLPPLMRRPSGILRQVDEGGVQIGDSNEEVGLDDRVSLDVMARIARRAAVIFPALERAQMVRSWAALRIMSPDGLPIYQQSQTMPGAALVTCHSGITLAAAHAGIIPEWLDNPASHPELEVFGEARFGL
jgi:glycine/D-amino acid oxidase-like deaminating enzyme